MEDQLERVMKITINHKYDQTDPQMMTQMVEVETVAAQICPQDQEEMEMEIMVMVITEMTTIQIQAIPSVI